MTLVRYSPEIHGGFCWVFGYRDELDFFPPSDVEFYRDSAWLRWARYTTFHAHQQEKLFFFSVQGQPLPRNERPTRDTRIV